MIDLGECIKVSKMKELKDGSADVEFEYTQTFIDLYKAATGKKATKKNLKKYLHKVLSESSKHYRKGEGLPCVIPFKKEEKKKN
jgi:chromosome segregation and condensation protein ScpB